jgi:hypothetical protein
MFFNMSPPDYDQGTENVWKSVTSVIRKSTDNLCSNSGTTFNNTSLGVTFLSNYTEIHSRRDSYMILKKVNLEKVYFVGLYCRIILQCTMQKKT